MIRSRQHILAAALAVILLALVAGCGGGDGMQRLTGLSPEGVVKTFVNAAKADKLGEAGLYVSPSTAGNPAAVTNFLSGTGGLTDLKKANIAAVKVVAQSGDYAAVLLTLQQENTFNLTFKPVGLERINGEWYIVDVNQIYQNAKYSVLAELLKRI